MTDKIQWRDKMDKEIEALREKIAKLIEEYEHDLLAIGEGITPEKLSLQILQAFKEAGGVILAKPQCPNCQSKHTQKYGRRQRTSGKIDQRWGIKSEEIMAGKETLDSLMGIKEHKYTTSDCPVYLESQGKTWSPYVIPKELCPECIYFNKQCDGEKFKR